MQFQLPTNPNIEHLKKQAKSLLAKARSGDPDALGKLGAEAKLSDAQYVLAKEYGFSSWTNLKEEVAGKSSPTLKKAIAALAAGKMCVLFDDEGRENEGDFIIAAEKVTAEAINFMAHHGRGTICVALPQERVDKLEIERLKKTSDSQDVPNFGQSLDLATTHTGVSASEKAQTIRHLVTDSAKKEDFRSPGHVHTLIETEGGIKRRLGHTEGSLELMKRAGLRGAAVICEIMNDDGSMARFDDLKVVAEKHDLQLIQISDLI